MSAQKSVADTAEWLTRARAHAAKLEERINALDNVFYLGCGFHYAKHEKIRTVRRMLDNPNPELWWPIVVSVRLEGLTRDVIEAEQDAANRQK